MRRFLVLLPLLAACAGPPPGREDGFTTRAVEERRGVAFAPGSAALPAGAGAALGRLAEGAATAEIALSAGPLAAERANALRAAIGRLDAPVRAAVRADAVGAEEAVVILRRPVLVPLACLGQGEPWRRPFVPLTLRPGAGGQLSSYDLLPPGCAYDTALLQQASNRADLFAGRALTPGTAGPPARAVERWYRRGGPDPEAQEPATPQLRRGMEETQQPPPGPSSGAEPAATPSPAGWR